MRRRWARLAAAGLLVTLGATGCFTPRRERPIERIARLRLQYRVSANWREMQRGPDGKPVLVMKLNVTNTGKERLPQVTMVLHVRGGDNRDRIRMPLTLNTADMAAGTVTQLTVRVPGVEVGETEEVSLEMEGQPTKEEMKTYPEYRGVS